MELAMETKIVLWCLFVGLSVSLLHWKMAFDAINDLVDRGEENIVGHWKTPWALAIVFLTCIGSLIYMMAHIDIGGPQNRHEDDRWYDDPWQIKRYN